MLLEDGDLVRVALFPAHDVTNPNESHHYGFTTGIIVGVEDFAYTVLLADGTLKTVHVMDLEKIENIDS